ncbi:MAG: SCO family protein [Chitinophagales bacterium]|nr:SCO family protein [Chitinophagales bacterium]
MSQKRSVVKFVAFGILIVIPIVFLLLFSPTKNIDENTRLKLPYFFPEVVNGDTVYHTIPPFEFDSHLGQKVTQEDFKNKIYVADFFYTTCPSICPIMSDNMADLQKQFISNKDLLFISHTVDPKHDTVEVLKEYADMRGAIPGKWYFVTGNKKDLYRQARKGYYISASENIGVPEEEDFIHSDRFVLVDRMGHIRGSYNGTDSLAINKLKKDIVLLLAEQ